MIFFFVAFRSTRRPPLPLRITPGLTRTPEHGAQLPRCLERRQNHAVTGTPHRQLRPKADLPAATAVSTFSNEQHPPIVLVVPEPAVPTAVACTVQRCDASATCSLTLAVSGDGEEVQPAAEAFQPGTRRSAPNAASETDQRRL